MQGLNSTVSLFSSFSKADGTRYNGPSNGNYDHSVMIVTRRVTVTLRPNFFQRLFGGKPVTKSHVEVDLYENYHVDPVKRLPLGLTVRRNINYHNYTAGTGNVPLRLATDKQPK